MLRSRRWFSPGAMLSVLAIALMTTQAAMGLQKVRVYRMGEDDGVNLGDSAFDTLDIASPPEFNEDGVPVGDGLCCGGGGPFEFVDLLSVGPVGSDPVYVEGSGSERFGDPSTLALDFNGVNSEMRMLRVDPRDWTSFSNLNQAWVKPDSAGSGRRQYIWGLGIEQGGVGITEEGKWMASSWRGGDSDVVSELDVAFDEWTHVAVGRFGNGVIMWVNGNVVAEGDGFWGGSAEVVIGNRLNDPDGAEGPIDITTTFYDGAIDDFNIASFAQVLDPSLDEFRDIDFLAGNICAGKPAADVNCDDVVNGVDYGLWSDNVLKDNGLGLGGITDRGLGDVDGNGRVNFFDLTDIRDGTTAGDVAPIIPEPSTGLLLMVSLLGIFGVNRRR